jgi:TetR/AcrR family tetracycline transcriptional repressor
MAAVPEPPWWRRRPAPEREKRPLTRELIVDAGLALLERDGLQGLSMRRLAQELGTGAASLYWHVGDKEELLSLLLDRIVGESEVPEPDPDRWQETVKQLARSARRHLRDRRDAAQLSLGRIPAGPNSLPILERNLAVLAASKLPPRVIAYAADMFALFVGAFAFEESLQQQVPEELGAYFASLPPEQFPTLARLADDLTAGSTDERFEFAIELLVRGLEAMSGERGDEDRR